MQEPNKKTTDMNDTIITAKPLNRLNRLSGKFSSCFHKLTTRFIGDMIYGIMEQKDIKLSSVDPTLKGKNHPQKGEDKTKQNAFLQRT